MLNVWDIDENQDVAENIYKKVVLNETKYGSVEAPISMHKTAPIETILSSQILYITNDENS